MAQLLQIYKAFREEAKPPETTVTPTLLDLTIDDNLSEFDRVVKYSRSNIGLQRLVHVKMIADVAKASGYEKTKLDLIPLVKELAVDPEPAVKQHVVAQLELLAQYCVSSGGEDGYSTTLSEIFPFIALLLDDEKTEVRYAATASFVNVSTLVKPDDLSQYVLTIVLKLAHEDDKEEMRMTASVLLNRLAHTLGPTLCKQFVIPEVLSLAEDPVFRVRKATALNFDSVCKVSSEYELFERLIPAFVRLSKDEMYRVRRACADSLSTLSSVLNKDLREGVMIEIFMRLSQDPSKLVRQSVLLQAGKFIATLSSRAVTDYILNIFISLADSPTGDASIDNELKHECAFSFPAVLHTIGYNRWDKLRDLYKELARCRSVVVKRTLALSLHEVAKILRHNSTEGIRLVEDEIAPLFEYMIQDVESVQVGVLKYLAEFFKHLSENTLLNYLPVLQELVHSASPFNWRLRELLARQLSDLVLLPPRHEIYNMLFTLAMSLLQDPVSSVRENSLRGVVTIVQSLAALEDENPLTMCPMPIDEETVHDIPISECLETVALAINSLAVFDTCHHRLLWIQLNVKLLNGVPKDIYIKYFLEGILRLVCDPVTNVRIALSELLTSWDKSTPPWMDRRMKSPWTWLLKRPDIKIVVKRLSIDVIDVYNNMIKLKQVYPDIRFQSNPSKGNKVAPGGADIVPIDLSEQQFITKYFSWDAVRYNFDETTNKVLSAEYQNNNDSSNTIAKRVNVNPITIAMNFVRGIKEKMNSRRNSFRDELKIFAEKNISVHPSFVMEPVVNSDVADGENILAKIFSDDASHNALPTTNTDAIPNAISIPKASLPVTVIKPEVAAPKADVKVTKSTLKSEEILPKPPAISNQKSTVKADDSVPKPPTAVVNSSTAASKGSESKPTAIVAQKTSVPSVTVATSKVGAAAVKKTAAADQVDSTPSIVTKKQRAFSLTLFSKSDPIVKSSL